MNTSNENKTPMQTKTIAKICKGKIAGWAKTVEQSNRQDIAEIISTKTIITGGALVSLLSGEEVNDFDVYFRDKESAFKVAEYYVNLFKEQNKQWENSAVSRFEAVSTEDRVKIIIKSQGISAVDDESLQKEGSSIEYQYFECTNGNEAETFIQNLVSRAAQSDKDYAPVFISDNAITLSNKIQIVIRFFGEPEQIHKNYDFIHCTNYYSSWDNQVHLNLEAMESIRTKTLKYSGSLYPICSIMRLRKFIARGWKINAGQILKIIWQIKDLDLDDYNILREQLVGVDSAYFCEMLNVLKQDQKTGKTIDQTYIANLVDVIFE